MTYKEAKIYFMTGTGNSYRVAAWAEEAAKERGILSSIYSIDSNSRVPEIKDGPDYLIGLVMPTHGFTAPWLMIRFAMLLPRTEGVHAIVIPTRGGTKIGPLFLPGLEGTAGYLIALILALKGYNVRGVTGINMPSSWTALHWGISPPNARAIVARAKVKVLRFVGLILSGKKQFGGLIELFFGLLLLPVSILYLLMGRFGLAKLFFVSNKCNGCGLCAENCPAGAIKFYGAKPYWTFKCESCMRCMNFCPARAIEASHTFAVAIYFLTAIPVSDYILNRLIPGEALINNSLVSFVIQYVYYIVSIYLAYWAFHALNRISIINRIFTITTLTHYYRRYHEPDTALKNLRR